MNLRYLLDGIGYISRDTVKKLIHDPHSHFTGFKRHYLGPKGAFGYINYDGIPRRLDIQSFEKFTL